MVLVGGILYGVSYYFKVSEEFQIVLGVVGLVATLIFYIIESSLVTRHLRYLKVQAKSLANGEFRNLPLITTSDDIGLTSFFLEQVRGRLSQAANVETKFKEEIEGELAERTTAIRDEQSKLVSSIQSLQFGFLIIDNDQSIALSNLAASQILDIPVTDVNFDLLVSYFGASFNVQTSYEVARSERQSVVSGEIDTHKKFLKVSLLPIISEEAILGTVMIIEDVTESVLLQRNKEEFFAVASHELRTPLTSIRGNMSLIEDYYKDKINSPEAIEMIKQAHQSAIRLIHIVNNFLDATKLEQGGGLGELGSVDLPAIIIDVVKDVSALAMSKNLPIVFTPPTEPVPPGYGDEGRLKEVVYNLIGNALNYTEKGRVEITIEVEGGFLKVIVRDTGIGISDQNQRLLFQKFQQAGRSVYNRTISTGTGMGLYISKLLVNAMHGEIGLLESSENGSAFFFTIPIEK